MMQESSKKILIIEDDAMTRQIFLDGLQAEGFETIDAENGSIGIQKAQEHLPDLVICDILMPEMDGFGVLAALRQDPVTAIVPFIFLTGSDSKASLRQGMELGADDYITKPCTVHQLLKAMTARLEKQAKLMQYWYAACYEKLAQPVAVADGSPQSPAFIFPSVPQLKEVFEYIEANFDQGITLCDVAEAVGYSSAYLTNRVAKITGETVNGWIVKRRMAAARSLLQETDQTIEQIASALGYQNACHFSRQFRQHNGTPPQSWRKEYQLSQRCKIEA
ncbi:two-component system response regulator [Scytonema hofmannii PCC 7110]|uniref:Two-component system response regulator n=1 Tax=Scytonema hofmannii PCC 7110 TaxID=128403 RepID=A0A139XAK9_9CYAN|nr:DNA-binding response regulator [Scytonema hofmannii]KYC41737.1 two-component system response regulator [Scytonema hofmannii PCC 7110]